MWIQETWRGIQEAIQRFGWEERLIIGVVILAIMVAVAFYVVRRVRSWLQQPYASISDHLSDFRKMREAGELDDKEFTRVVNTVSQRELDGAVPPKAEPPTQSESLTSPTEGG